MSINISDDLTSERTLLYELQCGTKAKLAPFPNSEKMAETEKMPIIIDTVDIG